MTYVNLKPDFEINYSKNEFRLSKGTKTYELFYNDRLIGLLQGRRDNRVIELLGMEFIKFHKLVLALGCRVVYDSHFTLLEYNDMGDDDIANLLDWFIGFCKSKGATFDGNFT